MQETMELQHFPFDVQQLTISFAFDHSEEEWVLVQNESGSTISIDVGFTSLAEWMVVNDAAVVELFRESYGKFVPRITAEELGLSEGTGRTFVDDVRPALNARIVVRRCWWRYFWSIGYIMAAIGLFGTSVFLIDPEDNFHDRLGTMFTLVLTSVAFQTVVSDTLPNMAYLSLLEAYVIAMNVLLIFNVVEICITKLKGWEEDFFFVYTSLILWILVHIGFAV